MDLRVWRFITIVLASLSLGMAFCHLLQLSPRMRYDAEMWRATQTMYQLFGTVGAFIEVGASLSAVVLVFLARGRRPAILWTLVGAACLVVAQAAWWLFVFPVNARMAEWTASMPADWTRFRAQWEYAHAVRAILELLGFAALVLSALVETSSDRPRARAFVPGQLRLVPQGRSDLKTAGRGRRRRLGPGGTAGSRAKPAGP